MITADHQLGIPSSSEAHRPSQSHVPLNAPLFTVRYDPSRDSGDATASVNASCTTETVAVEPLSIVRKKTDLQPPDD